MRRFGVLVLLHGLAAADPAPLGPLNAAPPAAAQATGPTKVVEAEPWTPPARAPQKYPGVTGKDSAAVVIDPGHAGDGQPWPYGIWIKPPVTPDMNVIVAGSLDLPDSAPLAARLVRGLDDSIGTMLELLMTPRFVRAL